MEQTGAEVIYAEEDYTPYDRLRSILVGGTLPLKLVQGQLGLHPLANLKANGKPYTVFTPYKRSWLAVVPDIKEISAPEIIPTIPKIASDKIEVGSQEMLFPAGEVYARKRLADFLANSIEEYHLTRDRMALQGTSQISPYIHFGILGMRSILTQLNHYVEGGLKSSLSAGVETWLSELIWREFYIQILYQFPQVRTQNFREKYDRIKWRNDPGEFERWKSGLTGYPLVDAGMRQLNETGWMHNRARMITASFLVKHLLIDWRWGERYFMDQLLDGDLAANNGGWQWVAGTGTDAAPYFRIFNPVLQSKKFDPDGDYLKTWIPELRQLDKSEIHAPWEKGLELNDYPAPMVDHKFARERTLITYGSV